MMKRSIALSIALLATAPVMSADNIQSLATGNTQAEVTDAQSRISQLSYIAQDQNQSVVNRARALQELAAYPSQNAVVAVARGLKDSHPEIREAAIIGSEPYQLEHRWKMVAPLLKDKVETVRHTAASNLVRDYNSVSPEQQQQLELPVKALIEFLSAQESEEYQLLFADVLRWHNQWEQADAVYVELLKTRSDEAQVWLSYADNFRAQQLDEQAVKVLDRAIEKLPNTGALHYSKSLTLVRLDEKRLAADEIEVAANLAKNNSYYWYLNGVLQEQFDIDKSTGSFEQAYLISGAPEQLYAVCDIYVRYGHTNADDCLEELSNVAPKYVIDQLKAKKLGEDS